MSQLANIKTAICYTFVTWQLTTFFYFFVILGLKQKAFTLQANGSILTDAQETVWFQREHGGGNRRTSGNGGRNTPKTLGARSVENSYS
ncbi:MAG: hypothetical protein KME57_20035 [Scytonema hyalinum WJT4-NPBG1]|jgi:hypothetical protein|nr:hypothetical protein [Scytonema hyalinum WJT4-NPBG1]